MVIIIIALLSCSSLRAAEFWGRIKEVVGVGAPRAAAIELISSPLLEEMKNVQAQKLALQTQLHQAETTLKDTQSRLQALRDRNAAIQQRLNEIKTQPSSASENEAKELSTELVRNGEEGGTLNENIKKIYAQKATLQSASKPEQASLLSALPQQQKNVAQEMALLEKRKNALESSSELVDPVSIQQVKTMLARLQELQRELTKLSTMAGTLQDLHHRAIQMVGETDTALQDKFAQNVKNVEDAVAQQEQRVITAQNVYQEEENKLHALQSGPQAPEVQNYFSKLPADMRRELIERFYANDIWFWTTKIQKARGLFPEIRGNYAMKVDLDGVKVSRVSNNALRITIPFLNKTVELENIPRISIENIKHVTQGEHVKIAIALPDAISIYDEEGKELASLALKRSQNRFDFNGNLLVVRDVDNVVTVFSLIRDVDNVSTLKAEAIRSWPFAADQNITDLRLTPDGSKIVITKNEGTFVYDIATGRPLFTLSPYSQNLIFNANGSRVFQYYLRNGDPRELPYTEVWDLNTGKKIDSVFGKPLAVDKEGTRIFRVSNDSIALHDLKTRKNIFEITRDDIWHKSFLPQILSASFTPLEKRILVATNTKEIMMLDAANGKVIYSLPSYGPASPEGNSLWIDGEQAGATKVELISPEVSNEHQWLDFQWAYSLTPEQGALIHAAREAYYDKKPLDFRNKPTSIQLFNSLPLELRNIIKKEVIITI